MNLIIYTDGGSRGNPGEGAVGVVIQECIEGKRKKITEFGKRIGVVTNNEAEYIAVIEALKEIRNLTAKPRSIEFILDSKLICEQMNGRWKIKQSHLRNLFATAKTLEMELGVPVSYTHVLRSENKRADYLLNKALDAT